MPRTTFATMGTWANLTWSWPDGRPAPDQDAELAGAAQAECARLETIFSRFIADSEISQLGSSWRTVSKDCGCVLLAANQLAAASSGFFNPLLGQQMRALATGCLSDAKPAQGRIEIRGQQARLVDARPGSIDLGGIAKGYAADKLRNLGIEHGVERILVTLGSSSIALAGKPAVVGLTSPWRGFNQFGTLLLDSAALSVSADLDIKIGRSLGQSHVLDPNTGLPALTDLAQVVVCAENGMSAEAYSTAFLAMGLEKAIELDLASPQIKTIFLTRDGRIFADPRLEVTAANGLNAWLKSQRSSI